MVPKKIFSSPGSINRVLTFSRVMCSPCFSCVHCEGNGVDELLMFTLNWSRKNDAHAVANLTYLKNTSKTKS